MEFNDEVVKRIRGLIVLQHWWFCVSGGTTLSWT